MRLTKIPYTILFHHSTGQKEGDILRVEDKVYELTEEKPYIFFTIAFSPMLLLLVLVLNRYDFYPTPQRLLEWSIAIFTLSLMSLGWKKSAALLAVAATAAAAYFTKDYSILPYTVKYFIVSWIIARMIYIVRMNRVYRVLDKGRLVSHLITFKENQ